ncbi:hypothetical protein HanPI659440_Chr13g0520011 [Helianthus annuus]|nr:hypothetical protein HanPI659440_Chr13g0520011 [Helianthus annuus]
MMKHGVTGLKNAQMEKISGNNDLKTQSYARATLLNIFCDDDDSGVKNKNTRCARYTEMIFLINPDMPHWDCQKGRHTSTETENQTDVTDVSDDIILNQTDPSLDIIFVHGLRGGPFKTWRLSECKSSSKSGLVEKIDEEAGKQGTFWPGEWLSADSPHARLFSLKYKTNLTQWSESSLPLQVYSFISLLLIDIYY